MAYYFSSTEGADLYAMNQEVPGWFTNVIYMSPMVSERGRDQRRGK